MAAAIRTISRSVSTAIESGIGAVRKARRKAVAGHALTSAARFNTVTVGNRNKVVVFNVCGNDFRLIAAIHYNRGIVYTLRFPTHAEYSKDKWKKEL